MNTAAYYCTVKCGHTSIMRITAVLLLLLCTVYGNAQPGDRYIIRATRLTTEDGLISNAALCGLQDTRGFIWIGSAEGLQRYDGKRFTLFNSDRNSLQSSKVGHMAEDKDGHLWLLYGSSEERLQRAGRRTDLMDLYSYQVKTLQQSFSHSLPFPPDDLKWLFSDEQRNLFLITGSNDVWWYKGKGVFSKLLEGSNKYVFFPHNSLYHAYAGDIWLSADSSIIHLDTSGHFREAKYPGWPDLNVLHILPNGDCMAMARRELLGLSNEQPRFAYVHRSGMVRDTALHLFPETGHTKSGDYLLEYHADIKSRNVICHNPDIGLQLLTDTGTILLLDTAALAQEPPLSPYAYFTDRSGEHWLCSSLGVYRFHVSPTRFTNYLTRRQLTAATSVGNQARGIWTDGDDKYIARDGLFRISDSGKHLARITPIHPILVQGDSSYIWYSAWFGSAEGLYRIRRKGGVTEELAFDGNQKKQLWGLYRSKTGIMYTGGEHFLGYINGNKVMPLKPCGNEVMNGTCYQFTEDKGQLFAVTDDGLYEITGSCYKPVRMTTPGKRFYHLFQDRNDIWWFCTGGDGLIRWDKSKNVSRQFTVKDGLPSNVLYALLEDENGLFWISSGNGLIRFNPATSAIKTFTRRDGLPDNEFNRGSFFKANDGRFYFGGINGVTAFDPAELPEQQQDVFDGPLQVVSLQSYNAAKSRMMDMMTSLNSNRSIILTPDDKFITLEVALLDYAPGTHRYEYRLEGLSNDWIASGDGNIRLDNLPYGHYILHIRGQNGAGAWSINELNIPLRVNAPFYKKIGFLLGAALLLIALLWLGVRWRLQLLKRANRRLEDVVGTRTRELRESLAQKDVLMKEIHHRVKNNLQVISALQQMQSTRSKDPQVKAALEDSQNRVLSIAFIHQNLYQHDDLKGVEMQSFVSELTTHILEVYITRDKRIQVTQDIAPLTLDIDTAVPIGLLINELLTNSCKHAFIGKDKGCIHISLHRDNNGGYILQYEDDGPGLQDDIDFVQAESLGLKLIVQLAAQLDGTLDYAGSRFVLLFRDFESRSKD